MKLPNISTQSAAPSYGFYAGSSVNNPALEGIEMSNIFGDIFSGIKSVVGGIIGKAPCVLAKAGPKGIGCLASCGPNPACLAVCAGPALVSSIMECI